MVVGFEDIYEEFSMFSNLYFMYTIKSSKRLWFDIPVVQSRNKGLNVIYLFRSICKK